MLPKLTLVVMLMLVPRASIIPNKVTEGMVPAPQTSMGQENTDETYDDCEGNKIDSVLACYGDE